MNDTIRARRRFFVSTVYVLALLIILSLVLLVQPNNLDGAKLHDSPRMPRMNEARRIHPLTMQHEPRTLQQKVAGFSSLFRRGGPELNSQDLRELLRKDSEKNRETASATAAPSPAPTRANNAGFVNMKCECREGEERR